MGNVRSVSGANGLKSQVVEILTPQKKPSFHLWFKILLGLVFLILCFTLYSGSLTWTTSPLKGHYHRFLNWTNLLEVQFPDKILPTAAPTGTLYHQAYARNYHFIMNNPEVCKTKTPFLILMVPVAPGNLEARDAIRQTWGNLNLVQGEVVVTLFMLGVSKEADVQQQEKLQQENLQHQDLIQSNFIDSYLNLTIKTMVIMDWLATFCPTAAYSMKIDSDMFLNIDNLVIMLRMPGIPQVNYLTGMLMWDRPVVRSLDSKWYVSEEMYPDPSYPTYTLGMGYVFSNDLPRKYVDISMSIKPFNIEDAYIGMCMKKLGLEPTSPPNPSQFKAYAGEYNRCDYSQVITYILGSAKNLIDYWTDLKKPGPPC
ncbi:beta-1,3-galactosyltransferase 2-like isoform X2 [Limanda limanda]|uniref:beta-1,3-galactosyltransferase 2-like isoform X2 n=1 Tax=Limanda limanda TaxID=27771 RepID=UPI0029C914A0|nr:beta-1,3-galactosyltransferase 2-like isoform X2 [Limanda limanda]